MTPDATPLLAAHSVTTRNVVHEMDALSLLRALPSESVNLIATDPPYFQVKDEAWDHQWSSAAVYIEWIGRLCEEWRRVLTANGSLYVFAWPGISDLVRAEMRKTFSVLNEVVWVKPFSRHDQADEDVLRCYFSQTERIIFAEQAGADHPFQSALIDGNATYWGACEASKRSIFGDYLKAEFERASVNNRQIAALFPSASGGMTGCVSNWLLGYNCPTPDQYQKMRSFLNSRNGGEYLRREYEDLRREYEDLRREYEDLRRPFNVSENVPYTDVWSFPTVGTYPGKHPAEKPLALMKHIVNASSRPGDVVLDCFCGSGTTLDAARQLGRQFIGCDFDAHWVAVARNRVALPYAKLLPGLEVPKSDPAAGVRQLPLLDVA